MMKGEGKGTAVALAPKEKNKSKAKSKEISPKERQKEITLREFFSQNTNSLFLKNHLNKITNKKI